MKENGDMSSAYLEKKIPQVRFWVTDKCNLRCKDCHWFSQRVKVANTVNKEDILHFIQKWKPEIVTFTGGEPTLWPPLAGTVNEVPASIKVWINTNGTNPNIFYDLRRQISIHLSLHQGSSLRKCMQILQLIKERKWGVSLSTYDNPENPFGIRAENNQMDVSPRDPRIGKRAWCEPTAIYFGSDGRAYSCEKGLRTKEDKYFAGFTLTEGVPNITGQYCTVDLLCLTATVQDMTAAGTITPEQNLVVLDNTEG